MTGEASIRQKRLATLLRATSGTFRVSDAMRALDIDRQHANKLLAGWHKQGVIRRVAHGLYVPVQPSALGQVQVLGEPWVLVPDLYDPGYIGGWSALEYWELTEQLFRSICILTSKRTTYGNDRHQGVNFFIKHIPASYLFGTKLIWRENIKIHISDPHKSLLDIVDDTNLGAGVQHTIDCLLEFKKLYGQHDDLERLLIYAKQYQNGALYKKLGFMAETLEFDSWFIDECRKNLTTGYAFLDKSTKSNKLVTKWRLWVPTGHDL